jgi:hypothetical protein
MATNVDLRGLSARADPRNVVNTLRRTVNYSDAGISSGITIGPDALPQGAFITGVWVEIVTVFNGGTDVLTVGTNSTSYNNIVAAGDVDETATGVTQVTRGLGRSIAASADLPVYIKYTTAGTATTGQAVVVIQYEGGWST